MGRPFIRAAIVLALLLIACARGARSQQTDGEGLLFIADDAASAREASARAPLVASQVIDVDGAASGDWIALPEGFTMARIATELRAPRFMAFDEAGNLLVADAKAGAVYRFQAASGAIVPADRPPAALLRGLEAPSSVALHDGYLYVGETRTIARYAYSPTGGAGRREAIVSDLPAGGHNTRTIHFGQDGAMYVSVGSSCNICNEADERRAAILRFSPDGAGQELFATGVRNAVGLTIQPETGLLWATVNERDYQGNEIPPDLVTIVRQGQNFGWPDCVPPDARPQRRLSNCSGITPPTVGIQAHSAPLGLTFYASQQFPVDYANNLFVAQHGSWNREPPAEPKLLRIHFDGSRPTTALDFATGWQYADGSRWGRPAGVVVAPDGSLIVSDDDAGVLYRVTYSR